MLNLHQNKTKQKILIFTLFLGFSLLFLNILPLEAKELEISWPEFGGIQITKDTTLPQLVKYMFNFAMGIGGIAAFAMLVWGGFLYLTSVGDPSKQRNARDRITSALIGLLLLLASYLLLQVVNPDLLILKPL